MQTKPEPSTPSSSGSDSRRRITTKREPRAVRDEQASITKQHASRRISGETTVAVTTEEALDGYCEKMMRMRISNVKNNTLKWVSSSSAGALDMTNWDFSKSRHVMKCDTLVEAVSRCHHWVWQRSERMQKEGQRSHGISVSCMKSKRRAVATSCMSRHLK